MEPEAHFFINIPFRDVVKQEDNIWEEVAKEFVKYAKVIQKDIWYKIDQPITCKECLSKSVSMVIESEKYVKK